MLHLTEGILGAIKHPSPERLHGSLSFMIGPTASNLRLAPFLWFAKKKIIKPEHFRMNLKDLFGYKPIAQCKDLHFCFEETEKL